MQFSLLYLSHELEFLITIYQAIDLPPRANGTLRCPYVKMFLLPDRGEESRRESKVAYETLNPLWNECFCYFGLTGYELSKRVLEVRRDEARFSTIILLQLTIWDFIGKRDRLDVNFRPILRLREVGKRFLARFAAIESCEQAILDEYNGHDFLG